MYCYVLLLCMIDILYPRVSIWVTIYVTYIYICQCNTYSHPRSVRSVNSFYHNSKTPSYRGSPSGQPQGQQRPNALGIKEGPGSTLTQEADSKFAVQKCVGEICRIPTTQSYMLSYVKLRRFYSECPYFWRIREFQKKEGDNFWVGRAFKH